LPRSKSRVQIPSPAPELFRVASRAATRVQPGRGTQVVRERSAKPLCVGSIPTRASKFFFASNPNDNKPLTKNHLSFCANSPAEFTTKPPGMSRTRLPMPADSAMQRFHSQANMLSHQLMAVETRDEEKAGLRTCSSRKAAGFRRPSLLPFQVKLSITVCRRFLQKYRPVRLGRCPGPRSRTTYLLLHWPCSRPRRRFPRGYSARSAFRSGP
jgi:hypothetical protein